MEVKSEPMDVQEDDVKVPLHAQCGQSVSILLKLYIHIFPFVLAVP